MPSEWNMFVKKIYEEGHTKNPEYKFKQALKDASRRKSEMGHMKKSKTAKKSISRKSRSKTRSMSMSLMGGKRTRRRRH